MSLPSNMSSQQIMQLPIIASTGWLNLPTSEETIQYFSEEIFQSTTGLANRNSLMQADIKFDTRYIRDLNRIVFLVFVKFVNAFGQNAMIVVPPIEEKVTIEGENYPFNSGVIDKIVRSKNLNVEIDFDSPRSLPHVTVSSLIQDE